MSNPYTFVNWGLLGEGKEPALERDIWMVKEITTRYGTLECENVWIGSIEAMWPIFQAQMESNINWVVPNYGNPIQLQENICNRIKNSDTFVNLNLFWEESDFKSQNQEAGGFEDYGVGIYPFISNDGENGIYAYSYNHNKPWTANISIQKVKYNEGDE